MGLVDGDDGWRIHLMLAALAAVTLAGCPGTEANDTRRARLALETFIGECAAGQGVEASFVLTMPARTPFLDAAGVAAGCDRILRVAGIADDAYVTEDEAERARETFRRTEILGLETRLGVGRALISGGAGRSIVSLEDSGEEWLVVGTIPGVP